MSASSSDRSDAGAPTVAETSLATRTATRPYIESMIESLRQAGDRPVLRWDGADTTGSQLLAAIYRYARALESLGIARGDLVAMYAPNRPEALAVRYATHLLGAASVYLSAPPDIRQARADARRFPPGPGRSVPRDGAPAAAYHRALRGDWPRRGRPAPPRRAGQRAGHGPDGEPCPSERPRRGRLLRRYDRRAEGQRPRLQLLYQDGRRTQPSNAPPAGQRQARLPDPGPGRHHAARRRHGHPAERIPACCHPRRDRDRAGHPSIPGRTATVRPHGSSRRHPTRPEFAERPDPHWRGRRPGPADARPRAARPGDRAPLRCQRDGSRQRTDPARARPRISRPVHVRRTRIARRRGAVPLPGRRPRRTRRGDRGALTGHGIRLPPSTGRAGHELRRRLVPHR